MANLDAGGIATGGGVRFLGQRRSYWRLLIRGAALLMVTLGIYRFWLVTVAIGTNSIFYWGWSIWLPTYLRTSRGFSFQTSGYLTFVIFGFAVATILVIGRFSDRIFRRAPLAGIGWICAAALLVASALAPSPILSVVLSIAALCAQQV